MSFFFFNDTATTEIDTLSLHDALPISLSEAKVFFESLGSNAAMMIKAVAGGGGRGMRPVDRKSTRLNSSHDQISYAVFCLKKKKASSLDNMKIARVLRVYYA